MPFLSCVSVFTDWLSVAIARFINESVLRSIIGGEQLLLLTQFLPRLLFEIQFHIVSRIFFNLKKCIGYMIFVFVKLAQFIFSLVCLIKTSTVSKRKCLMLTVQTIKGKDTKVHVLNFLRATTTTTTTSASWWNYLKLGWLSAEIKRGQLFWQCAVRWGEAASPSTRLKRLLPDLSFICCSVYSRSRSFR